MSKIQEMVRFLSAAGGSASSDGKVTHLFYEENNSLCVKTWTGTEFSDKAWVATGRVFAVGGDHTLRAFTEIERPEDEDDEDDEDDDEDALWEEEKLDDVEIRVHPKSRLAVSCSEEALFVFYQNLDGTLGAVEDDGRGWKIVNLPFSAAFGGTPLACFTAKDAAYLFYVNGDGNVRYLEKSGNEWKDAPFSNAQIDGAASKLSIAQDGQAAGGPKLLAFCLADGKLSTIKWESDSVETLGKVVDGVYQPTTDQECAQYYSWSPYPYYYPSSYVRGYGHDYGSIYRYDYDYGRTYVKTYYVCTRYSANRCSKCHRKYEALFKKCRC
ncbi:hypothetical protein Trco_001365 [Trichoderma cornu-damae]|uniref:Fucose-specific lectin n=1 Tax=Trichoderma cornu-damae TaxID=654480 RepID=A0A9P8QS71_9HYPO|nr:hypothetical protein Trco_001365 [Trichoderma cornu-damae]